MILSIVLLVPFVYCASVETPYGKIRGFDFTTFSGKEVEVFLGIPYAKPPIGELRFEKPEIVTKWENELVADAFGPACHVHHRISIDNSVKSSEDCLTVNIVTPKERNGKFPVVVYIHGGGFEGGSAQDPGYKQAAENFVAKGVIYATLQYRLGFLGFMTNGDSTLPGNLGLWDQALALKFLKTILPSFGGNIEQITLIGHSAGSASVSSHLTSPHSKDFFSQAIQLSGSIFGEWAFGENVVKASSRLGEAVSCGFNNKTTLKSCLKKKSIDELFDGMDALESGKHHPEFMLFHPHLDKDFFPEPVDVLFTKAPKKRTIQGITDDESALFTLAMDIPGYGDLFVPRSKRQSFSKKELEKFIDNVTLDLGDDHQIVKELALGYYDNTTNDDHRFYLQAYTDILSDLQFTIPVYQEIQLKVQHGWEPHVYVTKYPRIKGFNPASIVRGSVHGEELPYLVGFFGIEKIPLREVDKKFKEVLLSTFISFIKTGLEINIGEELCFSDPSTSTISWNPATNKDKDLHLVLSSEPELSKKFFRAEAAKLWLETIPSRVNKTKLKETRLPGLRI